MREAAAVSGRGRHTAAVLAAAVALALAGCGAQTTATTAPTTNTNRPAAGWEQLPPGPLSPRHSAAAVTIGDEVLIMGGNATPVCPPAAGCMEPDRLLGDGAAYDVPERSWRRLAPAPVPLPMAWLRPPVVLAGTVYTATDRELLAYSVADDSWQRLPGPPTTAWRDAVGDSPFLSLLAAGDVLVAQTNGPEAGTWAYASYDPADGQWRELPQPELSRSFQSQMVWAGDRVVVVAEPKRTFTSDAVSPAQPMGAATLDLRGRTWSAVPQGEGPTALGAHAVWTGDRVVVPYAFDSYARGAQELVPQGGYLDLDSGRWTAVATPPEPGEFDAVASTGSWSAVGHGLVLDTRRNRWHRLEPAGEALDALAASWVDDRLLVWGGGTRGVDRALVADGAIWTPPG